MSSDLDAFMAAMIAAPVSISLPEAQRIAAVYYGLDAVAERLTGERDENFKLSCPDGSEYVLKIAPAAEDPSVTDLPTAALLHVEKADPQLPCPRVRRDLAGDTQIRFQDAAGLLRTGRVLTYVAGQPLRVAARSQALRSACGRLAARLGIALRDFQHPASRRELIWDLRQLPKLSALLDEQPEFPRAAFVRDFIDHFGAHVCRRFDSLRQQVIHNDLNDRNIIISAADPTQLVGVIDYGDLAHTVLVADLAILVAEQIIDVATLRETVLELTGAYTDVQPLQADELELLPTLIAGRMMMSVVIPSWHRVRNPAGTHYARVTPDFVRKRLDIVEALLSADLRLR